jgi:hypothetical protein
MEQVALALSFIGIPIVLVLRKVVTVVCPVLACVVCCEQVNHKDYQQEKD